MQFSSIFRRQSLLRAAAFSAAVSCAALPIAAQAQEASDASAEVGARRGHRGHHRQLSAEERTEMLERRVAELSEELGLSATQQTSVREIFEARHEAMSALRSQRPQRGEADAESRAARRAARQSATPAEREARRAERQERRGEHRAERQTIEETFRTQLAEVLTDEQEARFRELRQARHEERFEQRFSQMSEALSLEAGQQSALREAFAAQREAMQSLRDEAPSEQTRASREAIHEAFRTQVAEILSDEQEATFRQLMGRRGRHGHGRGAGVERSSTR